MVYRFVQIRRYYAGGYIILYGGYRYHAEVTTALSGKYCSKCQFHMEVFICAVIYKEVLVGSIFSLVQVIVKVMILIFSIHKTKAEALLCDRH